MTAPSRLFSHMDTVSIVVSLAAAAAQAAGFDGILIVDTLANSSLAGFSNAETVGVEGSQYVEIGSYVEATDANTDTAGSVGTALLQDVASTFSHAWAPASIGILAVDLVGGDTLLDVFGTLDGAGHNEWYAAVPVSHALTTIADISKGVAATASSARKRIVIAQTSNVAAYGSTGGWDAAYVDGTSAQPAETTRERTFMSWHNSDAQGCAVGIAAYALSKARNPDTTSAAWEFRVPGISKVAFPAGTSITSAKSNIRANHINVPLPMPGTDVWLDPGVGLTGTPFYAIQSADWFEARLSESLGAMKVRFGDLNVKLPLSRVGQNAIIGEIEVIYQRGVIAGHFLSRAAAAELGTEVLIRAEDITSTDKTNRQLRFTVRIPVLHSTRLLDLNVTITP